LAFRHSTDEIYLREVSCMIDVERLKAQFDLRVLVERDLGKPRFRGRDYAAFRCPLHSEHKGWSLVVYPTHWRCFGKCQAGGDAIAWVQHYHQLSFQQACEWLARGDLPQVASGRTERHVPEPMAQPPDEQWQAKAWRIIVEAHDRLCSAEGQRARGYLAWERGLNERTIKLAQLGYIPGPATAWREMEGLRVPCGILIPWIIGDEIWGIKVRRAAGEQRYQQVSGGGIRGGLYLADHILPHRPLVITEGEFDALIASQVGWDFMRAVALGSASHARIDRRWYGALLGVPRVIACMDADAAGAGAAAQLATLSGAVRCVQVPSGKDLTEFYQQVGEAAVREWLQDVTNGGASS
jgi:DNA primase